MSHGLPALAPDRLQILVFGPGTGELILVRSPPGDWLVIDGCAVGNRGYAVQALSHYAALDNVRLVALTHAHEDHAGGLADLIDAVTASAPTAWPKLGMIWPAPSNRRATRELQGYFTGARVEAALSAMLDRWRRAPASHWALKAGDEVALGNARVLVRSPADDARHAAISSWRAGRDYDCNRVATAIEVMWEGHRIMLGSDLVEKPGRGWSAAIATAADIVEHDLLKVPHHGSVAALHDPMLKKVARKNERWFVVSPFASKGLPRFDRSGGIARLHAHADVVHLTALPRRHGDQPGEPLDIKRSQLERRGAWDLDPVTPGFPDCWVMVELSARPSRRWVTHGVGSVTVRRG